jgi:hypothetical protein
VPGDCVVGEPAQVNIVGGVRAEGLQRAARPCSGFIRPGRAARSPHPSDPARLHLPREPSPVNPPIAYLPRHSSSMPCQTTRSPAAHLSSVHHLPSLPTSSPQFPRTRTFCPLADLPSHLATHPPSPCCSDKPPPVHLPSRTRRSSPSPSRSPRPPARFLPAQGVQNLSPQPFPALRLRPSNHTHRRLEEIPMSKSRRPTPSPTPRSQQHQRKLDVGGDRGC